MILSSQTCTIDRRSVRVLRGGTGPRVLLLHGWGSSAEAYRDFFQSFSDRSLNVAIPDLPGFGASQAPPMTAMGPWGVLEYASWTHRLLNTLSWDKPVILFGHSFGGQISLVVAHKFPHRVSGLILNSPAIVRPAHIGRRNIARIFVPLLRPIRRFQPLQRFIGIHDWSTTPASMKPVMQKVIREDLTHLLPDLHHPTILLWGAKDRKTPVSHGKLIADRMPNADLRIFQGAAHSLRLDVPDSFREELIRCIQELSHDT